MPNAPKLAVLTGGTSEFMRWQTASQMTHETVYRVLDGDSLSSGVVFNAVFCLPLWREGYTNPDVMLQMCEALVVGNRPLRVGPLVASTADNDLEWRPGLPAATTGETGDGVSLRSIAHPDTRTRDQVFQSRGISPSTLQMIAEDCREALEAMIRMGDRMDAGHEFIGFTLQMLAYRFSQGRYVPQRAVAFPEPPVTNAPREIFDLYPQRLVDEELRSFGVSDGVRGAMNGRVQREVVMRIYRLHYMELTNASQELRAVLRDQLLRELYTMESTYGSPPRIRMPIDPPLTVAEETSWFLPDPVPEIVERGENPVPPPVLPVDPERVFRRVQLPPVPPPVHNYIPGQASERLRREMQRLAESEREANERERLLRPRRRGPGEEDF